MALSRIGVKWVSRLHGGGPAHLVCPSLGRLGALFQGPRDEPASVGDLLSHQMLAMFRHLSCVAESVPGSVQRRFYKVSSRRNRRTLVPLA